MNRRIAIRNMALILGSVAVLPSCLNEKGKPVITLKTLKIDAGQEALVNNLVNTILPKTATPGAMDLGINLFVFKMLDDCTDKEQQKTFIDGLTEFDEAVNKKYGHPFSVCSIKERDEFVKNIEAKSKAEAPKQRVAGSGNRGKPNPPSKLEGFYWMVKGQTVFGYTTSQYFMTKQIVYELVPGRYNAMFPVKTKAAV